MFKIHLFNEKQILLVKIFNKDMRNNYLPFANKTVFS